MRKVEATGKSVDEAIYNGLVQMGLSIDEVDIEIVSQGSRGLFGLGGTKVVVALTEKETVSLVDEIFHSSEEAPAPAPKREQGPPRRNENPTIPRQNADRPRRDRDRRSGGGKQGDRRREDRPRRDRNDGRRGEHSQQATVNLGEKIDGGKEQEFLVGILTRMGMDQTKVDCYACDDNCVSFTLSGPSMGVLIGRRGETLNALQYVVSLYANKSDKEYKRFVVDTENYRIKRENTLRKLAKKKAQEARSSGKSVALEPMNPYERRVLHSELQGFPGVTTHSEGEEPHRHVVIKPED